MREFQAISPWTIIMEAKAVYEIPECKNLEGLNLHSGYYNYLFKHRIDDIRLKKDENTLICSYPRTGESKVKLLSVYMYK